jgi:ParB family chromosome partitioning protein
MVDEKKLSMTTASEELSFLPEEAQRLLFDRMERDKRIPSLEQAKKLREHASTGTLTADTIGTIMNGDKPKQEVKLKLSKERISHFFPPKTSAQKMEETIIKALELLRDYEAHKGDKVR